MKKQTVVNTLVILFVISPVLYLLLTWDSIPETFVTRFKLRTTVEETQDKNALMIATVAISAISSLIYILMRNLQRVDPKVTDETPKTSFNRLGFVLSVLMTIGSYLFILSVKANSTVNVNVIFAVVGLFITVAGNYMNNLKPNYVAGIRLPWTLNDPENWRKTHQLTSKLWFVGGIILIIVSVSVPGRLLMAVFTSIMVVLVIVPCVYSYRIYKESTPKSKKI